MIGIFLNLLDTKEEKEKFTELYNEYKNLLYWIALKRTNNIEDAEECVQETFFYVAKHFDKIGEVKSKRTKGYLSTIVTGFAIDSFNDSIKANIEPLEDYSLTDDEAFDRFDEIELISVFDNVLDEQSKVFLYLKYVYKYKSSEIAEIYSVKDTFVRKKIQYAKEKVRKTLEERN